MENMTSSNDNSRLKTLVKAHTYFATGTYKFANDQLGESKNIPYHARSFLGIDSPGYRVRLRSDRTRISEWGE
jgi:hypothetical protein